MKTLHIIALDYLHPVNSINPTVWVQTGKVDIPACQIAGDIAEVVAQMVRASDFGLIRQDMWKEEGFTGYDGEQCMPTDGGCTALVRITHKEYDPYARKGLVIVEVLCSGMVIIQPVAYGQWRDGVPTIANEGVL